MAIEALDLEEALDEMARIRRRERESAPAAGPSAPEVTRAPPTNNLDVARSSGGSTLRAFTSGWPQVDGVMIATMESRRGGDDRVWLAARSERALRDLLFAFPRLKTALICLETEWMMPVVKEIFDGQVLTDSEAREFQGVGHKLHMDLLGLYPSFRGMKRSGVPYVALTEAGIQPARQPVSATADPPGHWRAIQKGKDPVLTHFAELAHAGGRKKSGQYLVEGVLLTERVLRCGQPVDALLHTPDLLDHPDGAALIRFARAEGVHCYQLNESLLSKVTVCRPSPLVVASVYWRVREATGDLTGSVLLVAEDIQSPDNLGMILRTADAAGADAVIVTGNGADPLHRHCVRAARGAIGRVPMFESADSASILKTLRERGFDVAGAALGAPQQLLTCNLSRPIALVVGNEQTGLTPACRDACSHLVEIPMAPGQDSLNVAVAAGLFLYEVVRQDQPPSAP